MILLGVADLPKDALTGVLCAIDHIDEISQQPFADGGHDGFRMKLDSFGEVNRVAQPHDFTIVRLGGDG